MTDGEALSRSAALLGEQTVTRLGAAPVLVVGVGGVGSWCAEALVRTGVRRLTLVDDDIVVPSNLNRQDEATVATLGQPKVEALRERLLALAPAVRIAALAVRYPETDGALPAALCLKDFAVIVDAIDSVGSKARLLLDAADAGVPVVSSMGAALRVDPTQVTVRRFDRVEGDGLARALRQRFKKIGRFPVRRFDCVCSTEPPADVAATGGVRGSVMPVTCAFGMALAAQAIRLLTDERTDGAERAL